jgi:polysaccharide transporter, PST family
MEERTSWFQAAAYLSMAALAAKGMSALYKIPYQNITGDTGFYVYQQVYPLYGAALVLGTYGFPLVIAKAVVEHEGKEPLRRHLSFYLLSLVLLFSILGTAVTASAPLTARLMGDPELTAALRWMGAPFFLVPFFALARGYYQGKHETLPTAVSQVTEQFVRVAAILITAWAAMQAAGVYKAGISAGIGALAGGAAGLVVLYFYVRRYDGWWKMDFRLPENWLSLLGKLLKQGLFVSASAMILVLFQVVDAFTIVQRLDKGADAAVLKGIYDRNWPLIQFGAVVTTVFSYAALPSVTKYWNAGRIREASEEAAKALKICFVFGAAAAAGMAAVMPEVNTAMFTDTSGTAVLQLAAPVVLFGSLFMTAAALLHAIGKDGEAALILAGAAGIKMVMNVFLVPEFGTAGASVASLTGTGAAAAGALYCLKKRGGFSFLPFSVTAKTAAAAAVMVPGVLLFQKAGVLLPDTRTASAGILLSASAFGAVLFIIFIWRMSLFSKEEWEELPKLHKLLPHRR